MGVLETILIVLEAICSIALIGVVLLQSGKEAGLSGALSGSTDSYMSKNKKGLKHNAGKAVHSFGDLLENVTGMF